MHMALIATKTCNFGFSGSDFRDMRNSAEQSTSTMRLGLDAIRDISEQDAERARQHCVLTRPNIISPTSAPSARIRTAVSERPRPAHEAKSAAHSDCDSAASLQSLSAAIAAKSAAWLFRLRKSPTSAAGRGHHSVVSATLSTRDTRRGRANHAWFARIVVFIEARCRAGATCKSRCSLRRSHRSSGIVSSLPKGHEFLQNRSTL